MPFTALNTRRVFPLDLYASPEEPHHVHLANGCTDHTSCPDDHWIGGHPEPSHPHHVEFDGETGQWGYTRLTEQEIADLQLLHEYEAEQREREEAAAEARLKVLRDKAREDPAFAVLLEQFGLEEK